MPRIQAKDYSTHKEERNCDRFQQKKQSTNTNSKMISTLKWSNNDFKEAFIAMLHEVKLKKFEINGKIETIWKEAEVIQNLQKKKYVAWTITGWSPKDNGKEGEKDPVNLKINKKYIIHAEEQNENENNISNWRKEKKMKNKEINRVPRGL